MENKETKKVDACCKCCPEGCTCGDCACCKEGVMDKKCCSSDASCCGSSCAPQWCPCCSRMRSCCWLCKLGKLLFRVLVILALWNLAFGGGMRFRWGMWWWEGCNFNGWTAISGQINGERPERKWWFNRDRKDKDDKVVSWVVVSGDLK